MFEDRKTRLWRLKQARVAEEQATEKRDADIRRAEEQNRQTARKATEDNLRLERKIAELESAFRRLGQITDRQLDTLQSDFELLADTSQKEAVHLREMIQSISANNLLASEEMREERRRETTDLLTILRELL